MPVFEYEVADPSGALSRGRAEADNPGALVVRFREQGRLVLSVRPAAKRLGDGVGVRAIGEGLRRAFRRLARGVGLTTLVLFTGQLSAMLAGGLHLARILTSLAAETGNKYFGKVLNQVRDSITAGSSFADALAQHPHIFDRLYVAVVRAGELSGSLPLVLDTLTMYLEKTAQLRRKVIGAVTYPAMILVVAIFIVFIMIVKLVPVFEGVYARANTALPAPTRLLIAISAMIRGYTFWLFVVLVAAALGFYMAVQTEVGRRLFDNLKLRLPLFGGLIRKSVMARTCRTLSVLLSAGIPLLEAMETVARVSGNKVIEEALMAATRRMQDGGTIAETLRETGEFPSMVVQLVATGEESGTLPAMLSRAAGYYEQQVDASVATLSTLIEPIMIVIMGVIAGGVIFALYLPIFTLGQAIKGGVR
ncbi:MAG TPA: type II secretion system F family protein [Methylomirabilota bacterium]|jgi:type IV pilus assembly protein PilC|nr:type II secretion system F family protein [Methylomirabilota bacterium]